MKNIALVGPGNFGLLLFEKFRKYDEVKYVCGRTLSDKLLDIRDRYRVEISDNYQEILGQVDLVIISTPTPSHYPITKDCLSRGKDVF